LKVAYFSMGTTGRDPKALVEPLRYACPHCSPDSSGIVIEDESGLAGDVHMVKISSQRRLNDIGTYLETNNVTVAIRISGNHS
jgi:hypothetical protein